MTRPLPLTLAGLGLALVPVIAPAAEQAGAWTLRHPLLGAPSTLVVTAEDERHAQAAVTAALAEVERLNGVFNSRREGSELHALNRASSMAVSPELFEVIERAEAMRRASGGAYNAGLGEALALWREAEAAPPSAEALQAAAEAAARPVGLDRETRTVRRPEGVSFALDGLAKGYIVDRALAAGLAAAPVKGMLVDIGGDMACRGLAPGGLCWDVGIPAATLPLDRAPLVAEAHLRDRAIATSGLGPRDRLIGGRLYSVTLSPRTGWAARENLTATVIADTAAEADALATALLVLPAKEGLALAAASGAEARITGADGVAHLSEGWTRIASEPAVRAVCSPAPQAAAPAKWNADWAVEITYAAPDRAVNRRDPDFRSPYMAMWITDAQNRPVRTLVLVGTKPEWQRDNYIWWGMYRDKATRLVELRSTATQLDGRYPTYWPGYNDDWKFMPQGEYILHIETSRERGKHTYRTVKLQLGKNGFTSVVPKTEEGGGITLTYGRRQ
jgi:thiamine biosynthesis lipoprotein